MKRNYYIFSNGRLVRQDNTVYLHQYAGERGDDDAQSLADAAAQSGCVLEDLSDCGFDPEGAPIADCGLVEDNHDAAPENELANELTKPTIDELAGNGDGSSAAATIQSAIPNPQSAIEKSAIVKKRPVPIEDVEAFYVFGEMDLNTKLLNFLARHRVPLHVFNYFGFYSGSFMPRQEVNSGHLLVRQVEHYSTPRKRLELARAFVDGASFNILKNLKYYGAASRGRELGAAIAAVEAERTKIATARDINTVMGIEGTIRACYYSAWPTILAPGWVEFSKRVKRPPDNPINALISFGNSLCYTLALGEIYRTPLSPLISFLHEPGARRYSLSLDIAEIFKPILCDRLLFKLINNGELQPKHFEEKLNFCYLKESGRQVFLPQWDERLKQTIEHRGLGRKISYRRLVRLECYRLERHLLGIDTYAPFKIWW
jgi:CRISPR-associated protein Cas1